TKAIRSPNAKPGSTFGQHDIEKGLPPDKNSITAEPLNKIFGMSSEVNNGMVKFSIGHPATMHGVKIDNAMGVNTWMAFAGSDENAVVDGDFAVTEDELQSALKAIPLPGANGTVALDYFAYDPVTGKVWVPASNLGSVVVIDEKTDAVSQVAGFKPGEIERRGRKVTLGPTAASIGDGVVYIGN